MMDIKNAVVKSVSLSNGDHGCLSAWLHLDYGGSAQGFGGYSLFNAKGDCAGKWIDSCINIAGVEKWEDIPGKTIRVKAGHRNIEAIGHILKDEWFCPKEDLTND